MDKIKMLEAAGVENSGIERSNVLAEDNIFTKMVNYNSIDIKRIIAFIGALYWLTMTVLIVPIAIIESFITFLLPSLLISLKLHNWIDQRLCRMVNNHWVSGMQLSGINVIEYGDDICKIAEKRVLFLANHLSLTDHFVIMSALRGKGTIVRRYLWVIFNIWKFTPLGVMWTIHGNFFINGGNQRRVQVLKDFKNHLKKYYWKYDYHWLIMYPEGSRFYLIEESNKRFALNGGYKIFKHCALPRSGAAHSALEATCFNTDCGEKSSTNEETVEYIVDCTIGYKNGEVPSTGDWLLGEVADDAHSVAVHYRVFRVKPEWRDEDVLKNWLYKIYEEKDKLLDDYYKCGYFPFDAFRPPRVNHYSVFNCLLVELFWFCLFFAHYFIWVKPMAIIAINYVFGY